MVAVTGATPEARPPAPSRPADEKRHGPHRETVAEATAARVVPEPALDELADRHARWLGDLEDGLSGVYGDRLPVERVLALVRRAYADRPEHLRQRDRSALLRPDWFQQPSTVGYAAYADRFGGTLRGVREHVDYLSELGVTYLHLMPLLRTRDGPDDGGYAVSDYTQVQPHLGTMDDLADLATALHERGITLTLDLVLNHVAREHAWARAARAGDPHYRRYFHLFSDRRLPDAYERTLPEVFPTFAPGSFTWDDEATAWVWTTFNSWQWDLDWSNPDVFCELLQVVLDLAARGVDCVRLDAIAFLWKRLGTNCQNQPEVHAITQALRAAAHMAAPALIFKAEAIVGPDQVGAYLGQGRHAGKVCDLAYDNTLMVQVWSALATRDVRMLVRYRSRLSTKPVTTAWATYLRCHDDIGWAIDDADTSSLGWDAATHRSFLTNFYTGTLPGSFARGQAFQVNEATRDARVCGTAASLAGVQHAMAAGDPAMLDTALGRLFCAHAIVYGFGGLPLLYMGDEIALRNDDSYLSDPAKADDARWMHRPRMPWDVAERRHDADALEGRVFAGLRHLARVRAATPSLHAAVETRLFESGNPAVLVAVRDHAAGLMVQLYNVSEHWQPVASREIVRHGLQRPRDVLNGHDLDVSGDVVVLPPYGAWWLLDPE